MDPRNLVEYLVMVSNKNLVLNFSMHILVLATVITALLIKNARVRRQIVEGTILVLLISVTSNAIIFGNSFHAITFGIMTIIAGLALSNGRSEIGMPKYGIQTVIALTFIILGLWYPELVKASGFGSLLISPLGIVPCPTLITILGIMTLFYSEVNKRLFVTIVFFGAVYGFIGTFKLAVTFDYCLIGAVMFGIYNLLATKGITKNNIL